ncbi:MAG: ergothioneine biosynthesis protein EgtB [Alphaproteobacteria bacterium]|nr:MAG: ergothioneine biosynthesis protein EgtB [Alphaproteobacteria bacterium]
MSGTSSPQPAVFPTGAARSARGSAPPATALRDRFLAVRRRSEALASPLSPEDAQVQSMPDVSPTKWHLAHTTWFFETFLLAEHDPGYSLFDPDFGYLFNSYYEALGDRHPRPCRGLVTRPSLERVRDYRRAVDECLVASLDGFAARDDWPHIAALIDLGCHHEEQHQELLLTDIKHVLAQNPLAPAYHDAPATEEGRAPDLAWHAFEEGVYEIGHQGDGFAYDNETPRHRRYVHGFALASRLVTNGEYRAFIEDGGYGDARLWLSDGWDWVRAGSRTAPLYWRRADDGWQQFTLHGLEPLDEDEPVAHLSHFEADAFARWAGARLPREEELEIAVRLHGEAGPVNDLGSGRLHPAIAPAAARGPLLQLQGDVWEWTQSAYMAYPGYRPPPGAVGEYNGKFMCNQYVLRGGSCVTPAGHWRPSYRNFFPAHAQWQFSGVRLAKDL